MAKNQLLDTAEFYPKTLLLGVYTPDNRSIGMDHYFEEFLSLVETLELPYDETLFFKVREVDKSHFFTKGKMQELVDYCAEHQIEQLVISELLTPGQEKHLEDALNCTVFDREKLILEIFKKSATTSEGKIQVEMAEMEYMRTRLMGKGKDYAQQAGYIGGVGPGETLKEEIKRHFAEKTRQAKKKLETLQRSRHTQRQRRLQSDIPLICIIGYTNAGKSSLLNQLTKSKVLAEDKLFATLDVVTREWYFTPQDKVLISDTVGFISRLPHNLIEAFKSTLDELTFAHLFIHVIDVSNPSWLAQVAIVRDTLKELGVEHKPMIYAFNKVDLLTEEELVEVKELIKPFQPQVLISTMSKEGVSGLIPLVEDHLLKTL